MAYLDRPAPPKGAPWAHNSLGASVHNALAGWWRLPARDRDAAAVGDLLARGWITEGYASPAQSGRWLGRARHMVERYVATLDPYVEPLGVERTVGTRTQRIALSGRIDRLDEHRDAQGGRRLVVVDYKTGRRQLTEDDARSAMALALYALAAARVFHAPCHRVELHHLPRSAVLGWEHTDASLERHLGRAESIAAESESADRRWRAGLPASEADSVFPPRPGPGCSWCDYRSLCPEGAAAAPAHRSWDGLADD
jgi:RecB family exonuclease